MWDHHRANIDHIFTGTDRILIMIIFLPVPVLLIVFQVLEQFVPSVLGAASLKCPITYSITKTLKVFKLLVAMHGVLVNSFANLFFHLSSGIRW